VEHVHVKCDFCLIFFHVTINKAPLGVSDHEMIVFSVLGEVKMGVSKTTTMDFQRADFGLFRTVFERVARERVLKGKGVQAGWTFFKEEGLKVQEQAVPICRKTNWR